MIPNLTWGADFAGLVRYLVENRDHAVLGLCGASSVELAADEMAAVAALNDRATNKLMHLSLSAALEDGQLTAGQWLYCVDRIETTLGLRGHQRVVVRHMDKTHDHVHVFWCTIAIETGQTPPKQWFLKKGCATQDIGPHALSDAQVAAIPLASRARRTYDFRALARCQNACRQLERELKLRQLRTPVEAARMRVSGEAQIDVAAQRKRAERVGSTPLIERADEIRSALDTPDWPSKRCALAAIGLDLEPVFRATKKGTELRGLVIYDAADPGNRIKASELDTPAMKYGCRRLAERHDIGAASFEIWWPTRELATSVSGPRRTRTDRLKQAFDLLRDQHRMVERDKAQRRKALRRKQANERTSKQRELMARRRLEASRLPPAERRAFFKHFSAATRAPELAALAGAHRVEAAALRRARAPVWSEYLSMCAASGDLEAAALLSAARSQARGAGRCRQPDMPHESAVASHIAEPIVTVHAQSLDVTSENLAPEDLLRSYRERHARDR